MANRMTATWLVAVGCVVFSALGCSMAAHPAATAPPSRISVTFVDPERFTDTKDSLLASPQGTAKLLADLGRYLRTAGERYVTPDQTLEIRVTNVDLAGEFEPWRGPQFDRGRIMRELYSPRIALEFTLTDSRGDVVKQGQRTLTDPLYLRPPAQGEMDALRYDKQLLGDWLRQEFAAAQAARPSP